MYHVLCVGNVFSFAMSEWSNIIIIGPGGHINCGLMGYPVWPPRSD